MVDYLVVCVAMVSGCCLFLSLIAVSLLVKLFMCVRTVAMMVSDVRPLASTESSVMRRGTKTSGGDSDSPPHFRSDDFWLALGTDARAVVALCLGWLASRC